jgi:hypothetical protein
MFQARRRTLGFLAEGKRMRRGASRSHRRVRRLFLQAMGGIYLIAFTSLVRQVRGLYGSRGILPMRELFAAPRLAAMGRERYRRVPSLFWLNASDTALVWGCRAGQVLAVAVMVGLAPQAALLGLWALYLSYVSAGRDFLSFQWDTLLLEMGLLAALTAPSGLRPGLGRYEPTRVEVLLWRMLVFRLYFGSGVSKLQSGDETWRELSACAYYYETAPLPTRGGWSAHHLPPRLHALSTLTVLVLETVGPFLAFAPRPLRHLAFWLFSGLQGLILATGNYGFFNLQSAALGLWLLEDTGLPGHRARASSGEPLPPWRQLLGGAVAVPLLALGVSEVLARFGLPRRSVRAVDWLQQQVQPLRVVNPYGLFAVMTVRRPEILLEGSEDGETWRPYTFRYKVGDPERPPRQVAPHQPRVDWQMWFAALSSPPGWLMAMVARLLEGSPDVLSLLEDNPFPERPPRYVRAVLYDYRMARPAARRETGAWWERERLGLYLPPLSLTRGEAGSQLQWYAGD